MKTQKLALQHLVTASLMSTGYISHMNNGIIDKLYVPYSIEKKFYLIDYLKQYQLQNFVQIKDSEFIINLTNDLQEYVNKWFFGNKKIFKKNFLTEHDYQAIIVCINLFGIRQLEGIAFPTTIDKKYLFTLCFTIGIYLNVKTTISNKKIKITDVTELFIETIYQTSFLDSSTIANYLSKKEKEILKESAKILEKRIRKNVYV